MRTQIWSKLLRINTRRSLAEFSIYFRISFQLHLLWFCPNEKHSFARKALSSAKPVQFFQLCAFSYKFNILYLFSTAQVADDVSAYQIVEHSKLKEIISSLLIYVLHLPQNRSRSHQHQHDGSTSMTLKSRCQRASHSESHLRAWRIRHWLDR